ncbi:hypothetical protein F53441_982 [Fusarium austroafricanum]|uniref:HTH APSES-type domain-containing protein n=1 Tax=Fusarium austroafricanum TaxID=2364996 RepID=A0A8H4KTF8_9HYPO|nr:hypothetical protein F53441_982 [Fusarium austroafricanum]
MLSVKSLLNPAPAGDNDSPFPRPNPTSEFPPMSNIGGPSSQNRGNSMMASDRAGLNDTNSLSKSKLRGQVRFRPFENLDELSLEEIRKFRVKPFGHIQETCLHIPYNSGKKDFFEKTGRESFEVFKYEFTLIGENTEFAVMWDYNVGLTMPAKMLGLNPGLKEITHSITGGSIAAQGYWMPYKCAKAICATFCYPIAGALIPIFGPIFPSLCVDPRLPDYGRMVINPQIIAEATRDAELVRRMHLNTIPPSFPGSTSYPRDERNTIQDIYPQEECRYRFRPRLVCDPSWGMDSDADHHYMSAPNSASSSGSGLPGYMVTSRPGSSWTVANLPSPEPNPWLSAVPRIPPLQPEAALLPTSAWGPKRRIEHGDWDYKYVGSVSPNMSPRSVAVASTPEASPLRHRGINEPRSGPDAAERNAAMLLLNFSMQDQGPSSSNVVESSPAASMEEAVLEDRHRRKRQRTASPFTRL